MATAIQAHITGTVWKIEVNVGDSVEEGHVVAILESMKMEMPVESPMVGVIKTIEVSEGQPIEEGATLMTIE